MSAQAESRRKRYATDPDYRDAVLARNRRWAESHPEAMRESRAAYYAREGERLRARQRERHNHRRPLRRAYELDRHYGITPEEYDAMLARQAGACGVCGCRPAGALHVDHDHESGAVRGLLCGSCNLGLGKLGDSIEALERALAYLRGAPSC